MPSLGGGGQIPRNIAHPVAQISWDIRPPLRISPSFLNFCIKSKNIKNGFKGKWQQKIFFAYLKEFLKLFSKLFYSFYISGPVFEILRLEERKKSEKSAILDIHGYARFTSQQESRNFSFFNQTLW